LLDTGTIVVLYRPWFWFDHFQVGAWTAGVCCPSECAVLREGTLPA